MCVCFGLVWLHDISTTVGYLVQNPIYTYKQFYFKQFSLTLVYTLNVQNSLI